MKRLRGVAGVAVAACVAAWLAPAAGAFTFMQAPGSPYALDAPAFEAALGDLNGDGAQDLLVNSAPPIASAAQGQVFLANGGGGFNATGVGVTAVTAPAFADFNGDGKMDVAGTNQQYGTTPASRNPTPPGVSVELGHGDGRFTAAPGSPISLGCNPSVVVGDFNGDGRTDIAAMCSATDTVSVLLGNGDGTFALAPGSPFSPGTSDPSAIAAGQFDGDGHLDLAVADGQHGTVSILLGNGDGTFTQAAGSPIAVGGQPSALTVGDFTGDGRQDLAIANAPTGDVTVLLGNGDGTFGPAPGSPIVMAAQIFGAPVAEDFNSDGTPDLAVGVPGGFALLLGDGTGQFTEAAGSPFGDGELLLSGGTFGGHAGVVLGGGMSASVLLAPLPSDGPTAALTVKAKRVTAGQRVTLDASGSSDPLDRRLTDYRWDLGNGRFSRDTATTPTLTTSFPNAGTVHVRVRVTNTARETGTATTTLVVHPAPRTAVLAGSVRGRRAGKRCMAPDRVQAVNAQGKIVATQRLKHGRFRLRLAPGRYTIRLITNAKHTHHRVLRRRTIRARAHHTTHLRFSFAA